MDLIKIPFSKGGLGRTDGCELAPDRIIDVLKEFNLNENGWKPAFSIYSVQVNQENIEETNNNIFEKIKRVTNKSVILGGDHSITYAAFKACASNNPGAGLVVFDAHPDCESDMDPPTHEDFLRMLINENIVQRDRVIVIGIRSWDGPEKEFLEKNNISFFNMKKIHLFGLSEMMDTVTETLRSWPSFYLSVDIDSVDPAFAPGTGYQEPGGLTSRELIHCLQRIKLLKNWQFADIVEVNPKKDINEATSVLAAKLVVELS
ncbi:MAG: arginase family protein [Candidatus Nanoarchaeia archaeon]